MPKTKSVESKKRVRKHADKVVTVPSADLQTKPSLPLKKSHPRSELGDSGTRMTRGIITEDYNPNLQGVQAMRVYDEMRKGDGTVRATMMVTTLPIRRAKWFIIAAGESTQDKEVAMFIEKALFEWIDLSWDDIIRQALLMIPFGVMPFEKVYGVKEHEGKSYVIVEKLAPRLPKSIQQWELTDGTFGIQQIMQVGGIAQIPGSKLLIFVNEKEGDNWWGTSMLRAAYKHWYYKNNFYKIDSVAFERQGLGIPLIKMPKGYTETDEQKAITALENLRASESAYLILPPDYEAEFMNMGSSTTRDPEKSINHHNKEILQSVLAQFLELGQTSSGGGSRALSEDHSDLFLKAMEAIANNIASTINKKFIPELVDMNFDGITIYPKIDFSGISRVDVTALGESYSKLVTAKGITPSFKDEQYLRTLMGLPEMSQEEIEKQKEEAGEEDEPNDTTTTTPEDDDESKDNKKVDDGADGAEENKATKEDNKKVDTETTKATEKKKIKKFAENNPFVGWRKLMFSEQKINLTGIQTEMNNLEAEFEAEAVELLNAAKDKFVAKIQSALDDDDTRSVADIEITFVKQYKALIKDFMRRAYEYGKNVTSTEMDVKTPASSSATLAAIDLLADTIAWKAAIDLETKAKISAVNGLKKLNEPIPKYLEEYASVIQVVGTIDTILEEAVKKAVSGAAGLIINQGINRGRKDVFEKNSEKIYALQRSEILDSVTCDFCLSMDGRVVDKDDSWASEDTFHNNCRGIWVEIMQEEPEKPDIDGIPDNLADYWGGEPNSLIQPPKPIVREDSPASDEVDARQNAKKKKK